MRGFAEFENTVDRGLAVIFDADSGLCLLNKIWISNLSSALIGMSSSKLFLFSKEVHLVVVSDLNINFGGSADLAEKRNGSADLHTPIHPPPKEIRAKNTDDGREG